MGVLGLFGLILGAALGFSAPAAAGDRADQALSQLLPEPSPGVRPAGGKGAAPQVQGALGRAVAVRWGSGAGPGAGDRRRRFRRAVTWILLMLAAAVVFLKFLESDAGEGGDDAGGGHPPAAPPREKGPLPPGSGANKG